MITDADESILEGVIKSNRSLMGDKLSPEEFIGYCLREASTKGMNPADMDVSEYVRRRVVEIRQNP